MSASLARLLGAEWADVEDDEVKEYLFRLALGRLFDES
jgi:hypothetical protein